MEQNRLSGIEFDKFIKSKKATAKYNDDMLELAKSDFEFGITIKQIDRYLQKHYNFEQMEILSSCIRLGYPEEILAVLFSPGMSSTKMEKVVKLFDDDFGVKQIEKLLDDDNYDFSAALSNVREKKATIRNVASDEPIYVGRLMESLDALAEKFIEQGERLKVFDERVAVVAQSADDGRVDDLLAQIKELNYARSGDLEQIAEKDKEIERKGRELTELEALLDSQQKKIDAYKIAENQAQEGNHKCEVRQYKNKTRSLKSLMRTRKSGIDIVKLIASGNHTTDQIIQIKTGMERGLSERQLMDLINNNVAADKMKVIIEVAVLENNMKSGRQSEWV